jgi:hypothetical protein
MSTFSEIQLFKIVSNVKKSDRNLIIPPKICIFTGGENKIRQGK